MVQHLNNLNYHSLSQLLLSNFNFDTFIASSNGTTGASSNNINASAGSHNMMSPNDDNFVIDPLLGFDLNDPFFVQNPSNFNVARPDPPMHENSEDSLSLTFSDKDDTGYLSISARHSNN
ncbi:unnamed protein product [[Candida] boidinii]|nr:unnamed protein product [[Candida] boidinii]